MTKESVQRWLKYGVGVDGMMTVIVAFFSCLLLILIISIYYSPEDGNDDENDYAQIKTPGESGAVLCCLLSQYSYCTNDIDFILAYTNDPYYNLDVSTGWMSHEGIRRAWNQDPQNTYSNPVNYSRTEVYDYDGIVSQGWSNNTDFEFLPGDYCMRLWYMQEPYDECDHFMILRYGCEGWKVIAGD